MCLIAIEWAPFLLLLECYKLRLPIQQLLLEYVSKVYVFSGKVARVICALQIEWFDVEVRH